VGVHRGVNRESVIPRISANPKAAPLGQSNRSLVRVRVRVRFRVRTMGLTDSVVKRKSLSLSPSSSKGLLRRITAASRTRAEAYQTWVSYPASNWDPVRGDFEL
jgi:hypothetical protein